MDTKFNWIPISVEHVDQIYRALHGNVAQYFYNFKTRDEVAEWVTKAIQKHEKGLKYEYVVFNGEVFIGIVSPRFLPNEVVDIGMWISPEQQRKGYGKKILMELLERLRADGVKKVLYETVEDNTASINLAISVGFTQTEDKGVIYFEKFLSKTILSCISPL